MAVIKFPCCLQPPVDDVPFEFFANYVCLDVGSEREEEEEVVGIGNYFN